MSRVVAALSLLALSSAFRASPLRMKLSSARPANVKILQDAAAVGAAVVSEVNAAAKAAVEAKGSFCLAIPGGSVLSMLSELQSPSWSACTKLAYVNHKCVSMSDASLATHAKAEKGFLHSWADVDVLLLSGGGDAGEEAALYDAQLRDKIPLNADGLPEFDLMLIGVGDDGHVGSLYPGRDEVLEEDKLVVGVEMKTPGSISLSLPVMRAAKRVVIAACGVSEKYPMGKSDAMKRAIEGEETLQSFPAAGLRDVAQYYLDEAAASKLSAGYSGKAEVVGSEESALDALIEATSDL
eukprot:scaffold797_cov236-Pinguiococcus_pyrenoidosus.AAC.6